MPSPAPARPPIGLWLVAGLVLASCTPGGNVAGDPTVGATHGNTSPPLTGSPIVVSHGESSAPTSVPSAAPSPVPSPSPSPSPSPAVSPSTAATATPSARAS